MNKREKEMKKIYKGILALAASLILVPVAFSQTDLPVQYQHEKYLLNEKGTIGYNKYLVSDTPNVDGEYTLRIENFVTGTVGNYALPTDFVMVLDNSSSMLYDYRIVPKTGMPQFVSKADNDLNHYIVKDDGYHGFTQCAYSDIYKEGSYGEAGAGGMLWEHTFANEMYTGGVGTDDISRYYYYEDTANPGNTGYYYIYHKKVNGEYRNLCIRLKDGNEKYLYGTTLHDDANRDVENINYDYKIIYTGDLWRPIQRREKLFQAVDAFVTQIKEENDKDQWAPNVTKHQLAIVAFGNGYEGGSVDKAMNQTGEYDEVFSNNSKVIKRFSEVVNVADFREAMRNTMNFLGSTYIDLGMTLGRKLFENLQAQEGMEPVNESGVKNRNKVMIFLTDGQPSSHNTASGWTGSYGVIKESLKEATKVKTLRLADPHMPSAAVNENGICGTIFCVDLFKTEKTQIFLEHLSSNYPQSDQSNTSGACGLDGYSGTELTPESSCIFYRDATATDLTDVFLRIAEATTGVIDQMVAVDVMADGFLIPFTTDDVDKVKIYTAECIGEKRIDGKDYLAFAKEVEAPDRAPIAHLWVPRIVNNTTVWVDLGNPSPRDIDGTEDVPVISFSVSTDGKKIIMKGFNYSELFCGIDPDETHTTGANKNSHQVADDDLNIDYFDESYRGYKLIFEFPIVMNFDAGALGGESVPTNIVDQSGLYLSDSNGNPIGDGVVHYPTPNLTIPVRLVIQKTGLQPGESANFTVQRKLRTDTGDTYVDFTTFVLTGDASKTPEVRIINLDPAYYYKVKEGNWSWAYENVSQEYYTTDPNDNPIAKNPIVFKNKPENDTPKHAEAKATNVLKNW